MYDKQPKYPTQYEESPKTINVPLRKYNELLKQRLRNLNQIEENKEKIKKLESKLFWYRVTTRFTLFLIILFLISYIPKYNNLKTENESLQNEYTKAEEYKDNLQEKLTDLNYSYQLLKEDYDNLKKKNKNSSETPGLLLRIVNSSSYSSSDSRTPSNNHAVVEYYIGNKNSKIFHKNYCGSAAKMNDSNKIRFETKEEARNAGYRGCGNCSP